MDVCEWSRIVADLAPILLVIILIRYKQPRGSPNPIHLPPAVVCATLSTATCAYKLTNQLLKQSIRK